MSFRRPRIGCDEDVRREPAVRERNLSAGRGTEGSRDARNNLEIDVRCAERLYFLGGAAEEHGVAPFEAYHHLVFTRGGDEERVDFVLREKTEAAALADIYALRGGREERKNLRADKGVVKDDIRRL